MTILRCCILLLIIAAYLPVTAHGLEVRFKDSALVKEKTITLGEVAVILPNSAEGRVLAASKLFAAPKPGEAASLETSKVKKYLIHKDKTLESVHWTGAKIIRVKRISTHIDSETVREVLNDFITRNKDILPEAEFRFKELRLRRPFDLPDGKMDVEVIPSDPSILNSHRFTIIFRVNGNVEKNIAVQGRLEAIAPIVTAAVDLRRGTIIQKEDIHFTMLDLIGVKNPSFDPSELVGKKIKRSVREGQPIDRRTVEFPPMIRRGELVTITAHKGALTVTAKGIARHDAKKNEVIKVVNSSTQKVIICKVSAPGLVKVEI